MKFTAAFFGGSADGAFATVGCTRFAVGMLVPVGDEFYIVVDGPISRTLEKSQSECGSLCVRCDLVPHCSKDIPAFMQAIQ